MNLLKIFKIIETLWPFIKEIVLDKDTPKGDRRKKGLVFGLLVSLVFFGTGAWSTIQPYVTLAIPPNQTSTSSQSDRDIKWVRFLEDRMTENVRRISELRRQVNDVTVQYQQEKQRADELQEQLDALSGADDDPDESDDERDDRLLNRLEDLRNSS